MLNKGYQFIYNNKQYIIVDIYVDRDGKQLDLYLCVDMQDNQSTPIYLTEVEINGK